MRGKDRHARFSGPGDNQQKAAQLQISNINADLVHAILEMLKKEQENNKELMRLVLDMAKKNLSKSERTTIIKTIAPEIEKPKLEHIDGFEKPELDNIYFDSSKGDLEANFDDLSDEESVSEFGISDDKIEQLRNLRNLVRKGE